MSIIFSLIGMASSLLLIPMGLAIGIYIPLVMTDTAYQIYNTVGMSNFARALFGSTNGVGVNWNNGFSQFLLWAVIIGAISLVISVLCNVIANWTRNGVKHSIGWSRVAYGVAAIVAVPAIFMLSITLTALIFNAISGNSSMSFITGQENSNFQIAMSGYSSKILSILGYDTFNLNGSMVTWQDALNQLLEQVKTIQKEATAQGLTDVETVCNNLINDIKACLQSGTAEYITTQINTLINISMNMTIGERISDMSGIQAAYDNLFGSQSAFSALLKDLNNLKSNSVLFHSGDASYDAMIWIFGGQIYDLQVTDQNLGFIAYIERKGSTTESINYIYSIENVFADMQIQSAVSSSDYYTYTSALNQIMNGCDTATKANTEHYWNTVDTPAFNVSTFIGLNSFYQRANPLPSFTLAGMINGFTIGSNNVISNYDILTLYKSGFTDLFTGHMERAVIGMMAANMMMATMMAYTWYMVGRVFELIILWLGSIIVAFKDDGEGTQFKIMMKTVVNKTLSIIFIEFVFTITNTLINLGFMKGLIEGGINVSATLVDALNGAIMLGTTILFCASYYMGNTLCNFVLGEAGQLRSFGDQYANISSTGRQQYGYGTKATLSQATSGTLDTAGSAAKSLKENKAMKTSFFAQTGYSKKDIKVSGSNAQTAFDLFKKTGGKVAIPKAGHNPMESKKKK